MSSQKDIHPIKKVLKLIALVYIASFLIINWNDVSWIFNYREISGMIDNFFNPYPSIDANSVSPYLSQNKGQQSVGNLVIKTNYTDKQSALEIPKISISVSIIFPEDVNKSSIEKSLDSGVVYYPGSVYPWQSGQIVILGHSAPVGWPKVKHDWVFSDLDSLVPGDNIFISLNNKQYTYMVKQKRIIERGADVPQYASSSKNTLTLISCWPPGKDYQRITVFAELDGSY